MTHDVRLSEPAEADADAIFDWIEERSQDGAIRWWKALQDALKHLERVSTGRTIAPESEAFPEPLYQIMFRTRQGRTYRAVYIVRGETIHVLRIRGPRQDLITGDDIQFPEE